jgi:divalent metal cation (Fe/Co/Zn/Cd) transporter
MGTQASPSHLNGGRHEREPGTKSVGLMLAFVGAATAGFFMLLGLIGLVIGVCLCYQLHLYYHP